MSRSRGLPASVLRQLRAEANALDDGGNALVLGICRPARQARHDVVQAGPGGGHVAQHLGCGIPARHLDEAPDALLLVPAAGPDPKALLLEERLRLTVLPFEQKGSVSKTSRSFQGNLIDALFNQKRFRVVERNLLDLILQEHKLSRTKLIDKNTAIKLGKLVATQSIITGSIIESRTGLEIVGRIVDTETSEILATEDVYDEIKDIKPDVKVLLSSGYSIEPQARKLIEAGCNGFIQKPFKLKQLSAQLRNILDNTLTSF